MGVIPIYRESAADSTAISNVFIDEYMKDANDAQIKIYLYLVRMMSVGLPTSIDEMADRFNHTEKDVVRALRYWESKGLLVLQNDLSGNISGIRLCALPRRNASSGEHRVISIEPLLSGVPVRGTGASSAPSPEEVPSAAAEASGNPSAEACGEVSVPQNTSSRSKGQPASGRSSRPSAAAGITPAQLETFKSSEKNSQLLLIVEQYIGKPLSVSEIRTIYYLSDTLKFSDDLIDYLVEYCVGLGKKDFRYIEKVALNWASEGITTTSAARQKAAAPKGTRPGGRKSSKGNAFHQFEQNDYDFEALEDGILKQQ